VFGLTCIDEQGYTNKCTRILELAGDVRCVCVVRSPAGGRVWFGSRDGCVYVYDLQVLFPRWCVGESTTVFYCFSFWVRLGDDRPPSCSCRRALNTRSSKLRMLARSQKVRNCT
jgi:hypothetical protein